MKLDLNRITEKLQQNDFIKNFIEELSGALENFSHQNQVKVEKVEEVELTPEEDLEFYRKESNFLQNYFKDELSDLSKGEIYLVTNKYDYEIIMGHKNAD